MAFLTVASTIVSSHRASRRDRPPGSSEDLTKRGNSGSLADIRASENNCNSAPDPRDVVGVWLTAVEPVVYRGASHSQDTSKFGLVDGERCLQFPHLARDRQREDVLDVHDEADLTAVDSRTRRDSWKDPGRREPFPCVRCFEDESTRSVLVPPPRPGQSQRSVLSA